MLVAWSIAIKSITQTRQPPHTAMPETPNIPEKPSLDGLEDRWSAAWLADGCYRFDRSAPPERVFAIDTPPPTVSGSLHVGHTFSYTHTDIIAPLQAHAWL